MQLVRHAVSGAAHRPRSSWGWFSPRAGPAVSTFALAAASTVPDAAVESPVIPADRPSLPADHRVAGSRESSEPAPTPGGSPDPGRGQASVIAHPRRLRDRAGIWDGGDPTCIWLG